MNGRTSSEVPRKRGKNQHHTVQRTKVTATAVYTMSVRRTKVGDLEQSAQRTKISDPLPGTVVRQVKKIYSCYGSRQTLTSPSDNV